MMNKKRKLKIVITGGLMALALTVYVPNIKEYAGVPTINPMISADYISIDPPIRPPN